MPLWARARARLGSQTSTSLIKESQPTARGPARPRVAGSNSWPCFYHGFGSVPLSASAQFFERSAPSTPVTSSDGGEVPGYGVWDQGGVHGGRATSHKVPPLPTPLPHPHMHLERAVSKPLTVQAFG
jgi:hypothetical protein